MSWPPSMGYADELEMPENEVILTVVGNIANKNKDDSAVFDLAMLRQLETRGYTTQTPWNDRSARFKGVTLNALLRQVGAPEDSQIKLTALDGYEVSFERRFVDDFNPILAYLQNNVPLSRRDKGPLWLILPRDQVEELQKAKYSPYWVWQIFRIEVQ